jgi:hypothetical protein
LKGQKTMFVTKEISCKTEVSGVEIENMEKFEYLGSLMMYGMDCKKDIAVEE